MKRFGRLPSPAMALAVAALVLSVAGNVTAAALITSAQIQDNTIRSVDIHDGTIKSVDVGDGTLTAADVKDGSLTNVDVLDGSLRGGDIADGTLFGRDVFQSTLNGAHVADSSLTGSDVAPNSLNGSDVADGTLTGADVAPSSLNGSDILDNSLTGSDVNESTFTPLDAHDAFTARCDPGGPTYLHCGTLTFNLGRPMPVIAFWNYAFHSENTGDTSIGRCQTRLDGATTATVGNGHLHGRPADFVAAQGYGATPVLDVIQLGAGNHTISLWCSEPTPDDNDFVVQDLRMGVVELGLD
jgi:hypothetical protein